MKITFYSNFLNHHQLPLSREFIKLGIDYTFVATEPIPKERINLGYEDMNKKYPFVLTTYDSVENCKKALELCKTSDLIILGSAPEIYIKERLKENKITFRYSERLHKQGILRLFDPILFFKIMRRNYKYKDKSFYLLTSSAYAATDYSKYGVFKNKMFKWGYFTEVKKYNIDFLIKNKRNNKKIKILWCGRLINWKHPELAIKVANRLMLDGYKFELNIIGTGNKENRLEDMIKKYHLENCVNLIGSVSSKDVRKYMEDTNIFLFTSTYYEGWGAVLNEAMNSGCAVVASHAIGSVPFLIKHKENGMIYCNGNFNSLYSNVIYLMKNKKYREKLGKNAYKTMIETWNPENAALRLIGLYQNLIKKVVVDNNNNEPAAISKPIKQSKMYKYLMESDNLEQ